jgi:16S rRNA (guanine527-N7)-methyltransferase
VVLAIMEPSLSVTCVDTVGKKAAFVRQVGVELGLRNLRAVHARVEQLTERFDLISSRAFATLAQMCAWTRGSLAEQGVWMAMKGQHPADEIAELPPDIEVFHVEQLQVPGLDAVRCLVWMRLKSSAHPA